MSKRIFVGAPFHGYINPNTGILLNDKRSMLEHIIKCCENKGHTVTNSHVREKWGESWMPPEKCTPLDYNEVQNADIFVAVPGNPPSGGVHVELGWASALKKRIIIFLEKGKKYSNLVTGLKEVAEVDYIEYTNFEEAIKSLHRLL
jgi:nucleoside 2-deoxyribosyltransferase